MKSNEFSSKTYVSAWDHIQEILVGRNRSLAEVKEYIEELLGRLEKEENHLLDISDRILDILMDAFLGVMEAELADQLSKMKDGDIFSEELPPDYLSEKYSEKKEFSPTLKGSLEILLNSLLDDLERMVRVACIAALGKPEPEEEEKGSYLDKAQDLLVLLKLRGFSPDRLAESIRRKPEFSSVK